MHVEPKTHVAHPSFFMREGQTSICVHVEGPGDVHILQIGGINHLVVHSAGLDTGNILQDSDHGLLMIHQSLDSTRHTVKDHGQFTLIELHVMQLNKNPPSFHSHVRIFDQIVGVRPTVYAACVFLQPKYSDDSNSSITTGPVSAFASSSCGNSSTHFMLIL